MRKLLFKPTFRSLALASTAGTLLLAGCAPQPVPPGQQTHLVAAKPEVQPPAIVSAPLPPPQPQQLVHISSYQAPDLSGPAANVRARYEATQNPNLRGYVNAVMVYTYEPGEVYKVDASPGFVTTIELEPGEHLISMAAGDTMRWKLGNTLTGVGPKKRVVILLKPIAPNLQTNIVITTSQRVYFLDASSYPGHSYQSGISWSYPNDQFRELQAQAKQTTQDQNADIGMNMNLSDLNFDYRLNMENGPRPDWFPTQVFDDGVKTFIRFPNNLGTTDAPPLFILERGNRVSLVNYQVKGDYYIVDRLFSQAELRFGEKPQTIVKITRLGNTSAQASN